MLKTKKKRTWREKKTNRTSSWTLTKFINKFCLQGIWLWRFIVCQRKPKTDWELRRFAKNFSSKRDLCELLLSNAHQYAQHTHTHTHKGKTVKYARLLNARRVFTPATNDHNNQIKWTKTPMAYSTFNKSGEQNRANGMKTSPKHAQTFAADAAFFPLRICVLWVCLPFSFEYNFYSIFLFISIRSHVLLLKSEKNGIAFG